MTITPSGINCSGGQAPGFDALCQPGPTAVNVSLGDQSDSADTSALDNTVNTTLDGGAGNDGLTTGPGNDNLTGGAGDDAYNGGAGTDRALFTGVPGPAGVNVRLHCCMDPTGIATGEATTQDSLTSIENVTGSPFDDVLYPNNAVNVIDGGDGADSIAGVSPHGDGTGDDTFNGGDGADFLSYQDESTDVNINVPTGTVIGGDGTTDTFSNFDFYASGSGNDQFTGDAAMNIYEGRAGNDTVIGAGGADLLDGGGGVGTDTLSYANAASSGATVDLQTPAVPNDGDGASDTIIAFENVIGSGGSDQITGSDGVDNNLQGGLGDDTISGGTGNDTLNGQGGTGDNLTYQSAAAPVTVDLGITAAQATGEGSDTLAGFENLTGSIQGDNLIGSSAANLLSGGNGDDTLQGRGGVDLLNGGAGAGDTASYANAAGPVTGGAATGANPDGDGASDSYIVNTIENFTGSNNADTLTGNGTARMINALGGSDRVLVRNAGPDVVDCGSEVDVAIFDTSDTSLTACETADGPGGTGPAAITASDPASGANQNSPRIQGTAPAGSTVTLYTAPNCTGTALASGTASDFTGAGLQVSVTDNSTTGIYAQANSSPLDIDGPSACSAEFTYVESTPSAPGDLIAPETTIVKLLKKTKDRTPTYSFRSSEAGSRFECKVDKGDYEACTSPLTLEKLKRKAHTFYVRAIDAAGNVDQTAAEDKFTVKKKRKKN